MNIEYEVRVLEVEKDTLTSKLETFEATNEILKAAGINPKGYQENNRIQYKLDGVEIDIEIDIDIDSWPMIPTYVEIEGKDEMSVKDTLVKLGLENSKVTALDVQSVCKEIYGIDIAKIDTLKF